MTYGDAIKYLANSEYIFKAIADLSQYADALMSDMKREADELKAEKRTIKKFLECDLATDQKLNAVGMLLEEDTDEW